ncbi:hypothetical protein [Anatilimnocola floriformis]|uniref:hypothetical protein n=1 Tax=Anatilimnocola floriformis TaxID=2948575 RepID=UPI0020C2B8B0|nr:hypothetical protein [Anatilimnocola floriformis]
MPLLLLYLALAADPAITGSANQARSENFEVYGASATQDARQVALLCERWRDKLQTYWLQKPRDAWTPRCQVVVHSTKQSYLAAVGRGGEMTRGSSWIEFKEKAVSKRKIDLLGVEDLGLTALAHEMTHVIFADLFQGRQPPRWADEGAAMLADTFEKQQLHQRDLEKAVASRYDFRVSELFALEQYPAQHRVPGFYGQSVSVAAFLARRDDPARFVKFIERVLDHGHDRALRDVYGIHDALALETEWRAHRNGGRGYHGVRLTLDARQPATALAD